jgi:beta-aspartyl-peptidase (threonine type)
MVKQSVIVLALVAIGLTGHAEDEQGAIRAVLDRQVVAWNQGDIEGFMGGYLQSEDLVFTSGGRVRRGWETTLRKYRERYGNAPDTMGHLEFGEVETHMLGENAAWVLGRWMLTWPDESSEGGVFTLVMQRTGDGWKVVHDHTSASSD